MFIGYFKGKTKIDQTSKDIREINIFHLYTDLFKI